MSRRSLLRSVFAAVAAPLALATSAAAAPTSGSTTVQTWTWTRLPNGLEVHCTAPDGVTTMTVRWTAGGEVTATCPVTLTATAGAVTMAGVGLTVRRAGA